MKVDYFDGSDIIINNTGLNLGLQQSTHFLMKGELFNNSTKFEGDISVVDPCGERKELAVDASIIIYTEG